MQILNRYLIRLAMLSLFISSACFINAQKVSNTSGFKFKKGYYYLTNEKGKIYKEVEPYSYAVPFNEGLALVEKNLKLGYIDITGKQVIDFKYINAGSFSEGLAFAAIGDSVGYINKQGEFVISPQFEIATDFKDKFATVLKTNPDTIKYGSGKWIYGKISKSGELIAGQYFSSIYLLAEKGQFKATVNDSVFYLSAHGKVLSKEEKVDPDIIIVDEMPQYPGGSVSLRKQIATSVRYPISAQKKGVEGRVYVHFVVDKNGDVVDVYSVCKELPVFMRESERVVRGLGKWKPGMQKGELVNVSYTVPINFRLR